jgi:hypothetical protein
MVATGDGEHTVPESPITAASIESSLRVILVGPEPELRKVPRSFTQIDPVSFVLAAGVDDALAALASAGARIVVVDLALPEPALGQILEAARRAGTRTVLGISRRDVPALRRRAERMNLDLAVFQRRPRNAITELVRNTLQYDVRRAPRAVLATLVRINLDGEGVEGEGVNIGVGGLLVQLPRSLDGTGLANLSFDLPGRGHRIIATARVVRVTPWADGFLTGLRFEAISSVDRAQIENYVRRTLEPPDGKLDPLHRRAARSAAAGLGEIRAAVKDKATGRRDHFRVRDLSETGAFLYPKPAFEHVLRPGAAITVLFKRGGTSISVDATVQRFVVRGSLEAQLFPNGLAVTFSEGRPSSDQIETLLRS